MTAPAPWPRKLHGCDGLRIKLHARALVPGKRARQQFQTLLRRPIRPVRIAQTLCDDLVVYPRVLPDIQGRHMKAEGLYPAQQALHRVMPGVPALVGRRLSAMSRTSAANSRACSYPLGSPDPLTSTALRSRVPSCARNTR